MSDNDAVRRYREALARTRDAASLEHGSAREAEALDRFRALLSDISVDNIRAHALDVYAADAVLDDTLQTIRGAEAIRDYFVETAKKVRSCTVDFEDLAVSGDDYYFRWTMHIRFKGLGGGETQSSIGVSQIRFDADGKVILHQDFWDSNRGFFEHVPVLGALIRGIKNRA